MTRKILYIILFLIFSLSFSRYVNAQFQSSQKTTANSLNSTDSAKINFEILDQNYQIFQKRLNVVKNRLTVISEKLKGRISKINPSKAQLSKINKLVDSQDKTIEDLSQVVEEFNLLLSNSINEANYEDIASQKDRIKNILAEISKLQRTVLDEIIKVK